MAQVAASVYENFSWPFIVHQSDSGLEQNGLFNSLTVNMSNSNIDNEHLL